MGTVPLTHPTGASGCQGDCPPGTLDIYLCENHKNGHFRILVLPEHYLMPQLVLESRYLEKGRQRDEHYYSRQFAAVERSS